MLGAITGDIVGSRFEFNNIRRKDFDFFTDQCVLTDDSIMTLVVAKAILMSQPDYKNLSQNAVECMQTIGRCYPGYGYGDRFYRWIFAENPKPYNSYGNGSAMRISAAGFAAHSLDEAKLLSKLVTEVTHNHPEGMKGAEATAVAIYLAKTVRIYSKSEIILISITTPWISPWMKLEIPIDSMKAVKEQSHKHCKPFLNPLILKMLFAMPSQ